MRAVISSEVQSFLCFLVISWNKLFAIGPRSPSLRSWPWSLIICASPNADNSLTTASIKYYLFGAVISIIYYPNIHQTIKTNIIFISQRLSCINYKKGFLVENHFRIVPSKIGRTGLHVSFSYINFNIFFQHEILFLWILHTWFYLL